MGLYGSPQIGYHASGPPPKKRRRVPLWLWLPFAIIGGLILLFFTAILFVAIVQVATGKVPLSPSPSAPVASAPASPSVHAVTPSASVSGPGVLLHATGTGPQITGRFTPKAAWDLSWSYDCGRSVGDFSAQVYDRNNQIAGFGVSDFGIKASGNKRYSASGTYYLQISSSCTWVIDIRQGP